MSEIAAAAAAAAGCGFSIRMSSKSQLRHQQPQWPHQQKQQTPEQDDLKAQPITMLHSTHLQALNCM